MPNTRKILIVDDDAELRDALTEQLSLHEEFEAVAAENGIKGVQTAKAGLCPDRRLRCPEAARASDARPEARSKDTNRDS